MGRGRARRKRRVMRLALLATSSAVGLLAAIHPAHSQGVSLATQTYINEVSAVSPALGAAVANSISPPNGLGGNGQLFQGANSGITIQGGRNGGPQYLTGISMAQVSGNVVVPQGVTLESSGPVVLIAGTTSPLVAQLVGVNFFLQSSNPSLPAGTFGTTFTGGTTVFNATPVKCTAGVIATAPACLGPGGLGLSIYNSTVSGAIINAGTIQNPPGLITLGYLGFPGTSGAFKLGAGINLYAATAASITNAGLISVAGNNVQGNGAGFSIASLPGIFLRSSTITGNVLNAGTILAIGNPPVPPPGSIFFGDPPFFHPAYGVGIDSQSRVNGSLINTGLISATTGGGYNAVGIEMQGVIAGGITNTGTIIGGTAAIDLTQEQAATTIVQAGGLIQGAITLSANADKLVLTGGVLNGAVTAPAGSAAVVSVPSGMPTLAAGTTITNVASFVQTGGTLVIPLTTNTASGNFPTVSAGAINLNGTLLASLQGGSVAFANAGSSIFKDVFVSGTPITGNETVTSNAPFLFNVSLVPDAVTANALDLSVALSPAAEAQTAQVLAQSLRFGLERDQIVVDTIENRILVGRSEQGPGLAVASARGDRLAVSDADQQAQVPAGGTGEGFAMWGRAYGTAGGAGATGKLPGFGEGRIGVLSGVDWRFDQFILGGAFHYAHTTAPFDDGSNTKLDNYEGVVYGGWRDGPAYVTALASGGANDYTISRNLTPFGLTGFATSAPTGSLFSAFGEAGYGFAVGEGAWLTPYVNLDYIHQHVDAFTEAGSFGAFGVAPANGQSLTTTLGLRASTSIDLGSHGTLVPEVRAGWQHEFLDASQPLTAQLVGTAASPFTVVGTSFGRDSAVVGVGVSHEFAPGASFFMDYDGQFTGGFNQNSGSVGIKVKF
jgi:outer membrane autotransporter protein